MRVLLSILRGTVFIYACLEFAHIALLSNRSRVAESVRAKTGLLCSIFIAMGNTGAEMQERNHYSDKPLSTQRFWPVI